MTRTTVLSWAGIAASAVAASAFALRPPVKISDPVPTGDAATTQLQRDFALQLQRRVHDPKNLEFGFSRVYKPGAPLHISVLQNRSLSQDQLQLMERKRDNEQHLHPGMVLNSQLEWVKPNKMVYVESFAPENGQERYLVKEANRQKLEVSVYTAGAYVQNQFLRVKGPAYLQKPTSNPIPESRIGEWAARQYSNPAKSFSGEISGWKVYAERVFGTEDRCISCHNQSLRESGKAVSALKEGDSIGLVVIATRGR